MWLLKLNPTTRLILISAILGVVGALGAQLFLLLLHFVEVYVLTFIGHYHVIHVEDAYAAKLAPKPFTELHWWLPVATTLGGLVAGLIIYGIAPETEGHGTDAALNAFHRNNGRMRARVPFVKTVASALTIGSGGSGGREGPTAQIASGVGAIVGQLLKLPDDERRLVLLAGMAAGLSAIFKSPLGTAIFAVEILYSGMAFEGSALIYTMIAAAVAYAITGMFSGFTPLFLLPADGYVVHPVDLVWFALLGVLAGGFGALLPAVFYRIRDGFRALRVPVYLKPALGGLAVGLIGIVLPPVTGGGYGYMQFMLQGGSGLVVWVLLLLSLGKMLTASLTIGSGGSGGMFGPTLYVGTALGATFAAFLHILHVDVDAAWLAVVGMAAVFAGGARVPIASMVMVIEMTGGFELIMPTMLAVAIAFVVQIALTRHAKYPTIYEAQVPMPGDSRVHREAYYETVAKLLRDHEIELDRDLLAHELQVAMDHGSGLAIAGGNARMYHVRLRPGSPVAGSEVRSLGLAELGVLIVSVIRGEREIVPNGSTTLQVSDRLLVAASEDTIDQFRTLVTAPLAPPVVAASAASESADSAAVKAASESPGAPDSR
jgi:CIC family chloride channel protein